MSTSTKKTQTNSNLILLVIFTHVVIEHENVYWFLMTTDHLVNFIFFTTWNLSPNYEKENLTFSFTALSSVPTL